MQNLPGWTAGFILKKLRGVRVKIWADQKICLHRQGLRVNSSKTQGFFSKVARPNRYAWFSAVGSRSDGQGLRSAGSNHGRRCGSNGPGRLGRGRRRGSPELPVPRRRVTGEGQSGALGLGLGLGLAGEVDRGMRNPLGWISRCCGGAKQGAWRGGGSAWRSIAGDGG